MNAQSNYCALVWMFFNWNLINNVKSTHERSLRFVYSGKSFYEELLEKDDFVSYHRNSLRGLAIEMF